MPRLPQSILQERWTARAESEVRFLAKVLSLAFTTKRRKDTPSSSGAVFPQPSSSPVSFSLAMHAALDSAVVEVHFIPTFNKAVQAPPGLY